MKNRKKICFITAIPMTVEAFLIDYLHALEESFEITVITDTQNPYFLQPYGLNVKIKSVPIKRNISIFYDIRALIQLYLFFRKNGFMSVHSVTPKAGLLSMLASSFAKVPNRIHTFTGQVWATKRDIKRWFLKKMDRIIVQCATHVLADSSSQKEFLVNQGIAKGKKVGVIGHGSISGVDMDRFSPNRKVREEIRQKLHIASNDFVFLFVGRINREKGIFDLLAAFKGLASRYEEIHLIIVGPDEEGIISKLTKESGDFTDRIHYVGPTKTPENYMVASDCLCLPSYREGFGLVVVEAAACGIPAIGSRIYGIVDAIEEYVTGLLHSPGHVEEMSRHMEWMILNKEDRLFMGERAKERVALLFSKKQMVSAFTDFYKSILN